MKGLQYEHQDNDKDVGRILQDTASLEGMAVWFLFTRGGKTDSDVDILVVLDHSQPVGLKFFGMYEDLKELLGRNVDLVTESSLAPFAKNSVERDRKLIYERTT